MSFEWDEAKRRLNLRKHKIEFADAVGVFEDRNARTMPDEEIEGEQRFVTLGMTFSGGCWSWRTRGATTRFA